MGTRGDAYEAARGEGLFITMIAKSKPPRGRLTPRGFPRQGGREKKGSSET